MLSAIQTASPCPSASATLPTAGANHTAKFATLLAAGRKPDTRDPAVVQQAATQFLSELFFTPLLAEARQFPLGGELADGGRTEAIFGEQLDQRVADAVVAADPELVQQMVRRLAGPGVS